MINPLFPEISGNGMEKKIIKYGNSEVRIQEPEEISILDSDS
jgi:hypothetical protein